MYEINGTLLVKHTKDAKYQQQKEKMRPFASICQAIHISVGK